MSAEEEKGSSYEILKQLFVTEFRLYEKKYLIIRSSPAIIPGTAVSGICGLQNDGSGTGDLSVFLNTGISVSLYVPGIYTSTGGVCINGHRNGNKIGTGIS